MEDVAMRTFDLTPLFRSSVGYDRLSRLMDSALRVDEAQLAYPPYNIEQAGEDSYRITMAVAGFSEAELTITAQENQLVVSGKPSKEEEPKTFLHRGIAGRAFERRFELADHIRVTGADLANGLLHIDLKREVPEAMKPRTISIGAADKKSHPQVIEGKAA
jgi:molecular chaperone IbpA